MRKRFSVHATVLVLLLVSSASALAKDGVTGATGPTGPTGAQGATGPVGATGATGPVATIEHGVVFIPEGQFETAVFAPTVTSTSTIELTQERVINVTTGNFAQLFIEGKGAGVFLIRTSNSDVDVDWAVFN